MLKKDETDQLQRVCQGFAHPLEFILHRAQDSQFGLKMKRFVEEICRLSPGKIRAVTDNHSPDPGLQAYPCFSIRTGNRSIISYAAVPLGHQFTPFMRALEYAGRGLADALDQMPTEAGPQAELQVFISEQCPHCPLAVESAVSASIRNPLVSICIVDAEQFPDLTHRYGIRSVPATILDRRLVLIGMHPADRLLELVELRGTFRFEMEVFQSLIDTAKIAEAADSLSGEAAREVILSRLDSPDFSKRLSALVVVEKALERNPGSVHAMVPLLVSKLSHEDSRIRGDVADLLGKIGDPQAIPQLELLMADPDPDVAEAADEAIAELRKLQG